MSPRPAARPLPPLALLTALAAAVPPAVAQSDPAAPAVTPPAAAAPAAPGTAAKAPRIDPARLSAELASLTGYPTRHTASAQNVDAAKALRDRFREMGYADVSLEEFPLKRLGLTRFNVVAVKPGATAPEEIVLLGAHFDSRNKDARDARGPSPGADDNGTGTVAVLEIARRLAAVPTDRTVRFVLFSGEEQGLVGSAFHSAAAKARGERIVLMANLDMIGFSSPPGPDGDAPPPTFPPVTAAPDAAGARRAIYVESDAGSAVPGNDAASRRWAEALQRLVFSYGLGVSRGPLVGTDYIPFEKDGFAVVGLYDGADTEPFYHNAADLPAVVDADFHARAASAMLDLIEEAAGARPVSEGSAPGKR